MQTVKLAISGMHCTSCSLNIDFEIEDLEGVHDVRTHYARQETTVTFDPDLISLEKIIETIQKLEYIAKPL